MPEEPRQVSVRLVFDATAELGGKLDEFLQEMQTDCGIAPEPLRRLFVAALADDSLCTLLIRYRLLATLTEDFRGDMTCWDGVVLEALGTEGALDEFDEPVLARLNEIVKGLDAASQEAYSKLAEVADTGTGLVDLFLDQVSASLEEPQWLAGQGGQAG